MKEIEVLVEVYDDIDKVKEALKNFEYKGKKVTIDEYYYDPLKNNEYSITYKDDVFDNGKWLYSNEYESKVESIDMIREIFSRLGLVKFIEINNEKETYIYNDYEIVLENVKDLGVFLEVEYCTNKDVDVKEIKTNIQIFIDELGISVSPELNMGKPEMYMKKHNIKL